MPRRVVLAPGAQRQLRRLPREIVGRTLPAIRALAEEPRPSGVEKLQRSRYEDVYRIRVGDYRVLYQINDESEVVTVVSVAHRRDAYRR